MNTEPERILVVDDEATARVLVSRHLTNAGYEVAVAPSPREALQVLAERGCAAFHAVVTDYLMPERNGLDLLESIKQQDETLASVLVTAVKERNLVKEGLREGVCDFIDKPAQRAALLDAVKRAVALTAKRRQMQSRESSVREVGQLQQFMLGMNSNQLPARVDVCWHPCHEVGGDLVNLFRLDEDRMLILVADVSGHDLKAGFVSAFFQGLVRGMVEKGTPIQDVLSYFNGLLVSEWNNEGKVNPGVPAALTTSVCACALLFDFRQKNLSVFNSGLPLPTYVQRQGGWGTCNQTAGPPLGWYEGDPYTTFSRRFESGGSVYCWTDGMEDLADRLGVSVLSLAARLLKARQQGVVLPELEASTDDLLLVRIDLESRRNSEEVFPLIFDLYLPSQLPQIDQFQEKWRKSIRFALPGLSQETLYDVLLCSREAVINALKHGCKAALDQPCSLEISTHRSGKALQVRVSDPGPGHDFNWADYVRVSSEQLLDEHRGLALIHQLPTSTVTSCKGAEVKMEFRVSSDMASLQCQEVRLWGL